MISSIVITLAISVGWITYSNLNYGQIIVVRQDSNPVPNWRPANSIDISNNMTTIPKLQNAINDADRKYNEIANECRNNNETYDHGYCGSRPTFAIPSPTIITKDEFQALNKTIKLEWQGMNTMNGWGANLKYHIHDECFLTSNGTRLETPSNDNYCYYGLSIMKK